MTKAVMISGLIVLIFLIVFFSLYFFLTAPKYTGTFSVDDFSAYIENEHFQTEARCGELTDYRSAAKAGKSIMAERFGNTEGSIFEWTGCDVRYDSTHRAYYVRTDSLTLLTKGGGFGVIRSADGTVLAIWGEK